jgi:hypothetical protein
LSLGKEALVKFLHILSPLVDLRQLVFQFLVELRTGGWEVDMLHATKLIALTESVGSLELLLTELL